MDVECKWISDNIWDQLPLYDKFLGFCSKCKNKCLVGNEIINKYLGNE